MNNNDILRRLRYALSLSDAQVVSIFALNNHEVTEEEAVAMMLNEEEEAAIDCTDIQMGDFLDGLILERRGPRTGGGPAPVAAPELTNNAVLKKLRIALNFHEQDMLDILVSGGRGMSRGELSALFRKPDHKHYRGCGDQVLRNFLTGLTLRLRSPS
jgi:uncharacterized protein YehS (DUF1456 family)